MHVGSSPKLPIRVSEKLGYVAATRQLVNRADRIGPLGAGGFEAGEVVPADERLPCRVHRGRIERLRIVPGVVAIEHRRRAAVVDVVAIALADGVVRGVKVFAGVFDGDDGDVVGQQRVEAAVQVVVR